MELSPERKSRWLSDIANPMRLFAELKRRNVFRVALLYCISSWLVLQVADVLFGILGVPDWSLRLVFGLLLLGLPPALVFAWVFELTPEGLRRERASEDVLAETPETRSEVPRRLDGTIVVLLVLALGLLAADRWILPRPSDSASSASAQSVQPSVEEQQPAPELNNEPNSDPNAPSTLAVLPFVNMSEDPDNEFFSDGLTEELLNALAQVEGLRVAARTSSFRFKGHVGDMADIARQLRVDHLLEGSVRRAGDRVRITAQLINSSDGLHLWSQTYDRQLNDIFAIQDDIASEVAIALRKELLGEVPSDLIQPPTDSIEAYTAYLRGKQALRSTGYQAYQQAKAAFGEALELDPEFAAAHAALADTWRRASLWGIVPWTEASQKMEEGAARALQLDSEQPLAMTIKALAEATLAMQSDEISMRGLVTQVEPQLRRVLELDPGQMEASDTLSWILWQTGRPVEAFALLQSVLDRDPLSALAHKNVADHYRATGQLELAAERYQTAIELDPQNPAAASGLARLRAAQGKLGESIVLASKMLPLDPFDHEGPLLVASLYIELGMTDAAKPWIDAAEDMAPEATTTQLTRALWFWRRADWEQAAAIAKRAIEMELPDRSGSDLIFERMLLLRAIQEGRADSALENFIEEHPSALEDPAADAPIDTFGFSAKIEVLPLLRLAEGDVVARERASLLLAHVEDDPDAPSQIRNWRLSILFGVLGRPDDLIATWRELDDGQYQIGIWFWTETDLRPLPETVTESPMMKAYLAEQEAVRERERMWLTQSNNMPDPATSLAAMAEARERAEVEIEGFGNSQR